MSALLIFVVPEAIEVFEETNLEMTEGFGLLEQSSLL
jgi:hypothetical protein